MKRGRKGSEIVDPQLVADFAEAERFVLMRHPTELEWIRQRSRALVDSFEEFFEEYTYVVVASGFRGSVAARLTPLLVKCKGRLPSMLREFKNEAKCRALHYVYQQFHKPSDWLRLRSSLTSVDSLCALPRIGAATKFHLARNIGLCSDVAKPDIHLVRYAEAKGFDSPLALINQLLEQLPERADWQRGAVDFVLWVWLSHGRGEKELPCCRGEGRIR